MMQRRDLFRAAFAAPLAPLSKVFDFVPAEPSDAATIGGPGWSSTDIVTAMRDAQEMLNGIAVHKSPMLPIAGVDENGEPTTIDAVELKLDGSCILDARSPRRIILMSEDSYEAMRDATQPGRRLLHSNPPPEAGS